MTRRTPLTTIAAALVLALALLLGVMLHADNTVYAANPVFGSGNDSRSIPENTPPGVNIEAPIRATDADEGAIEYADTLTYSLNGHGRVLLRHRRLDRGSSSRRLRWTTRIRMAEPAMIAMNTW